MTLGTQTKPKATRRGKKYSISQSEKRKALSDTLTQVHNLGEMVIKSGLELNIQGPYNLVRLICDYLEFKDHHRPQQEGDRGHGPNLEAVN